VSLHPLIDLSNEKEVRKAAGFRVFATGLVGEALAGKYSEELANAPRRSDAGKRHLVAYNTRLAASRNAARDAEHLSIALVRHCVETGAGLALPEDAGTLDLIHCQVALKSAAEEKEKGDADPNRGVGKIDLLGIGPDDRMAVIQVKYAAPSATRGGTGDTPLRALLETLAHAAIASANREAIQSEVTAKGGGTLADKPPIVVLLGTPRYWQLCRKREAQKGAAWIKEMERLAKEIEEACGVTVIFASCQLEGDPGWSYPDNSPVLDAPPRLVRAWEHGAGKVRPKPRPRPKVIDPADLPVEPDMTRPVRDYAISGSFDSGDRINHPTLGLGVVQGGAGNGKIFVLFGEKKSLLIHERAASAGRVASSPLSGAPD
jgi:hypothetical protein